MHIRHPQHRPDGALARPWAPAWALPMVLWHGMAMAGAAGPLDAEIAMGRVADAPALRSDQRARALDSPKLALVAPMADAPSDATALRHALQHTLWPADVVRLADDFLRQHPQHPWAAEAQALRSQALPLRALLQRTDVQLFRAAFNPVALDDNGATTLRLAAAGDASAALRMAALVAGSTQPRRRIGWLQYAAALGSGPAAYALALHYRQQSQPLMAAQLESQALALGHVPPPALDHLRK